MNDSSWLSDPWWTTLGRFLWWLYTRVVSPVVAFGLPALIIYGLLQPRSDDVQALQLQRGEIALLVGKGGGRTTSRRAASRGFTPPQRTYIVFPRVLSDAAVTVVEDRTDRQEVRQDSGFALNILAFWLVCAYATWRFFLVPLKRHLTTRWSGP